jgi:hypothetical integral membrane protein (TIGR02206 family)
MIAQALTTEITPTDDFHAFSTEHLVTLGAIAAIGTALIVIVRSSQRPMVRSLVCWTVAGLTMGGMMFKQIRQLSTGTWTLDDSVPLHLCDIGNVVTLLALIMACRSRRPSWSQWLYELAYFWGLGGTIQALLTPDVAHPYPHPAFFRFFVTHGGIVVGVLVMTIGLRMRPRPSAFWKVWLATITLACVVFVLNFPLGANYMYLHGPPKRASIIDLMGPWPWSLIPLVMVGTLLLMLVYSPFWVRDRYSTRNAQHAKS